MDGARRGRGGRGARYGLDVRKRRCGEIIDEGLRAIVEGQDAFANRWLSTAMCGVVRNDGQTPLRER